MTPDRGLHRPNQKEYVRIVHQYQKHIQGTDPDAPMVLEYLPPFGLSLSIVGLILQVNIGQYSSTIGSLVGGLNPSEKTLVSWDD